MITITYKVTELGDGFKQYDRIISVPNYRTLRSLLSAVDAACHEIEADQRAITEAALSRAGVDL